MCFISRRIRRLLTAVSTVVCLLVVLAPAGRAEIVHATAGPWVLTGWQRIGAGRADQGLATVVRNGRPTLVTRGNRDVSRTLARAGWWHIGDPGSRNGYLLDVYQSTVPAHGKLFVLTAPDGHVSRWVHHLVRGELVNNSFAAVSPDGRWFVSGEWGKVDRLLVFPMPGANPAARPGHDLPLAATIRLTRPVRNVQGCSFATDTQLVCATDDYHTDLFGQPRQLLSVTLAHSMDGRGQGAVPRLLGGLPQVSGCGVSETEGVDVAGRVLRVLAHEPGLCRGTVDLFTYTLGNLGSTHAHPGR